MNHDHVWKPTSNADRTILALHGTGGDENSLVDLASSLDPMASVLGVRGNVLEGSMPRFFRRLSEGVFDEADLVLRTNELADFVAEAASKYRFDPHSLIALGYSNGANIAAAMLLLRPESLAGAILLRAMPPLDPQESPDLVGKRVLLCSGDSDPLLPVSGAERLARMLSDAGADISFEMLHAGHGLTSRDFELALAWLNE
jgi:phospholipase/carboxylesterase